MFFMDKLCLFGERLKELMFDEGLSFREMAAKAGADLTMVYRWLRGDGYPRTSTLIRIADAFSCSLDYLLGMSDDSEVRVFRPSPISFGERLRSLLIWKNLSEYRLVRETGISRSRFRDWRCNIRLPSPENLCLLADYLDVTADFLVGREG